MSTNQISASKHTSSEPEAHYSTQAAMDWAGTRSVTAKAFTVTTAATSPLFRSKPNRFLQAFMMPWSEEFKVTPAAEKDLSIVDEHSSEGRILMLMNTLC